MHDSRTGLEGKTKRELVELLLEEVSAWPGDMPLSEEGREWADAVLTLLGQCRLWLGETHWHGLCSIWVSRSAQPDAWLRKFWLQTLHQWLCFLDDIGLYADSPPEPALASSNWRPAPVYKPTEPGHLPFGFVRPLTG